MRRNRAQGAAGLVLFLAAPLLFSGAAAAQSEKVKGVITGRSGATMTLQAPDGGKVDVVLTPSTKVEEPEGVFRKKHLAMTALVPGLAVSVNASFNAQNQLVADSVEFHGSDLKTAQDIQAGLTPTQQQVQAEQKVSAEHAAEIEANKGAIAAANKRFSEMGDYNVVDEVTVLFGNGQVDVEEQYKPQLVKLAQHAKGIPGYLIQVKGYASSVGSAALNQKLSAERAENVVTFLEQQGQIPLTNMLAPGAMGTSELVASDTTTEGQAENRRVVVKVLQNKGIAGN